MRRARIYKYIATGWELGRPSIARRQRNEIALYIYSFWFFFLHAHERAKRSRSFSLSSSFSVPLPAAFTVCCSRRSSWLANRYTTSARHVVASHRRGRFVLVARGVQERERERERARERPIPLFHSLYNQPCIRMCREASLLYECRHVRQPYSSSSFFSARFWYAYEKQERER